MRSTFYIQDEPKHYKTYASRFGASQEDQTEDQGKTEKISQHQEDETQSKD